MPTLDSNDFIRRAYAGQVCPTQQQHFFSHSARYFPVRRLSPSPSPSHLATRQWDVDSFRFHCENNRYDMYDYLSRNRIKGLLLLHRGEICFEYYSTGLNEHSHWLSMSLAKSISSTLAGIAIKRGDIASLDTPLLHYLPQLGLGAYRDVTVRQLLQMSSGADWNEDHTDPNSQRRIVLELQIAQKNHAITGYMSSLPKLAPSGTRWNYSTGETHLVGALLQAATGKSLCEYLQEHIWHPMGMELDASWWLEAPDGLEVAGSGFNACLRDYGRFALFVLNGGRTATSNSTALPDNWLDIAAGPTHIGDAQVPYGLMWWSLPDDQGNMKNANCSARGIFGQRIYLNPKQETAAVIWSGRSKPIGDEPISDNDFFNAFCKEITSR